MEKTGCTTRSQAQAAGAGKERSESDATRVAVAPTPTRTKKTRSIRVSREAARLRAEYDAEVEIAKVREGLIKKKLALEMAQIEDEFSSGSENRSVVSETEKTENVKSWLEDVAVNLPAGEATCSNNIGRKIPLDARPAPPLHDVEHCLATSPRETRQREPCATITREPRARDEIAPVAPPPPPSPPTQMATCDVMQLADAIISLSANQDPSRNLPEFDGNPVDWLAYRRAFENTYKNFTEHQNIIRLQKTLRGSAKRAVEDLLRTGTAPEEVVKALEEEFGHPNRLLENAIRKIRNLPRVSDGGAELRQMTTEVRNCVYVLKNIRADGYINNPQLTQEILSKLTPVQRAQYGEYVMKIESSQHQNIDMRISPSLDVILGFLRHLTIASSFYLPLYPTARSDNAMRSYDHRRAHSRSSARVPLEARKKPALTGGGTLEARRVTVTIIAQILAPTLKFGCITFTESR